MYHWSEVAMWHSCSRADNTWRRSCVVGPLSCCEYGKEEAEVQLSSASSQCYSDLQILSLDLICQQLIFPFSVDWDIVYLSWVFRQRSELKLCSASADEQGQTIISWTSFSTVVNIFRIAGDSAQFLIVCRCNSVSWLGYFTGYNSSFEQYLG